MVLVTGATGTVGGEVLRQLVARESRTAPPCTHPGQGRPPGTQQHLHVTASELAIEASDIAWTHLCPTSGCRTCSATTTASPSGAKTGST
jgi:hypothetical protein